MEAGKLLLKACPTCHGDLAIEDEWRDGKSIKRRYQCIQCARSQIVEAKRELPRVSYH